MSIGSRIKQRREELGYTQPQLASLIGVSKGTIGNYESGISSPNENILFRLFEVLRCDANFLYQDDIKIMENDVFSLSEQNHIKKYRTLDEYSKKVVDSVLDLEYERCSAPPTDEPNIIHLPKSVLKASAGTGNWLDEQQLESVSVVDTPQTKKANLIIEVDGDSMEPLYSNGDNVLVNTKAEVSVGDIGIFIVDGNGYIKKLGDNRLISVNPEYDDIFPTEYSDFRCVGKVLGKADIVE